MILGNWKGQREKMEAVMLSRSRDWIAESLAGEKAAETQGESNLHKKLGLCEVPSQPMGGYLGLFIQQQTFMDAGHTGTPS